MQFDFLGTWNDSWAMLTSILERPRTRLVLDLWYQNPEPVYIDILDSKAKDEITKRPSVYVWANDYSRFPPVLKKVKELYMLQPTLGGPSTRLTLPACYEREGLLNLACGHFVCHDLYLNPETGNWEKPSAELKSGYKDILVRMKQHLILHKFHKPIWTGVDALRVLKEGKARITGFGLNSPKTYEDLLKAAGESA